ncbi:MAG: hypothetical protein AAFZ74_02140 [Pseudomonadota bacterium]
MNNLNVRPARPSDRLGLPRTGEVWVMEENGKLLGYGGVLFGTFVEAFLTLSPDAFKHKVALAKGARAFRRVLSKHENVYAFADEQYETAPRFLQWIGFDQVGMVEGRELYRWHTPA